MESLSGAARAQPPVPSPTPRELPEEAHVEVTLAVEGAASVRLP